MARSNLVTAASVVLYVNNAPYAKVLDFHFSVSTPRNKLYGIDSIIPFELALSSTSVDGSMTIYRQSQDGGAEGPGFTTTMPELSRGKYFSVMLIEEYSHTILFEATRCSLENQSWSVVIKQHVIGSLSFSALEYNNEVRPGPVQ